MLEQLKKRLAEIEMALMNTNQQLLILKGHKNEVEFQIGEMQKESLETQVEVPVE